MQTHRKPRINWASKRIQSRDPVRAHPNLPNKELHFLQACRRIQKWTQHGPEARQRQVHHIYPCFLTVPRHITVPIEQGCLKTLDHLENSLNLQQAQGQHEHMLINLTKYSTKPHSHIAKQWNSYQLMLFYSQCWHRHRMRKALGDAKLKLLYEALGIITIRQFWGSLGESHVRGQSGFQRWVSPLPTKEGPNQK